MSAEDRNTWTVAVE